MNIIPIKANDAGTGGGRKYNLKPILWMSVDGSGKNIFGSCQESLSSEEKR
jgi:hypothetical protein